MSKKYCHGAGNKKILEGKGKSKNFITTALVAIAAIGIFFSVFALSERKSDGVSQLAQGFGNDVVMIPLSQLNNGNAHFYSYPMGGKKLIFLS